MDAPRESTILEKEKHALTELLALLRSQQHAMIHGRFDEMSRVISKQEKIVSRVKTLERQRRAEAGAPEADSRRETPRFEKARTALRDLVARVQQVNRQNTALIHRSLSLIRRQLEALAGDDMPLEFYTGAGNSTSPVRRSLLNRKV